MKNGFSLLELSIVLVIIGLIAGGIVAGSSMIRAAELRSVLTQRSQFQIAVNTFRDKYFALPGDMKNATAFWGEAHATPSTCRNTASTGTETCDGDGDGNVELFSAGSYEIYRFWQHLANAELINGTYTGARISASHWSVGVDVNSPPSKLNGGGWAVIAQTQAAESAGWYDNMFPPSSKHWFEIGGESTGALYYHPIFTNGEAWNLDTKSDDGKPSTGNITTFNNTEHSNCADSDITATASYQLDEEGVSCTLLMGL